MCGLFGYSFKPGYLTDDEVVRKVTTDGFLFNRGRGIDAFGWVAQYHEPEVSKGQSSRTWWLKKAGDPNIVQTSPTLNLPSGIPNVCLCHTRAASRGAAANNDNNHPVISDNVYVTHNGTISNHTWFKNHYGAKASCPDVDTYAISLVLSHEYPDPSQPMKETCLQRLDDLSGPWAIAAVWDRHPGYTLLVRGVASPLLVARHPQKGYLWASEKDAIFKTLETLGENHLHWKVFALKPRTAMVLKDGVLVRAFKLPLFPRAREYGGTREPTLRRMFKNWPDMLAAHNGEANHWVDKDLPSSAFDGLVGKDIFQVDPEKLEGLNNFMRAKIADCDAVFYAPSNKKSSLASITYEDRLFILYGIWDAESPTVTEIISSGTGSFYDVYLHKKVSILNDLYEKWIPIPRQMAVPEKRVVAPSVKLKDLIAKESDPVEYAVPALPGARTSKDPTSNVVYATAWNQLPFGKPHRLVTKSKWPIVSLGTLKFERNNFEKNIVFSLYDKSDGCVAHKRPFVEHTLTELRNCDDGLRKLRSTLAWVDDLDYFRVLYGAEIVVFKEKVAGVTEKDCYGGKPHSWEPSLLSENAVVEEECDLCGCVRTLWSFPIPLLNRLVFGGEDRTFNDWIASTTEEGVVI